MDYTDFVYRIVCSIIPLLGGIVSVYAVDLQLKCLRKIFSFRDFEGLVVTSLLTVFSVLTLGRIWM